MTNTFSFSRLLQLIRKQWVENSRFYFFCMLALLAVGAIVFCLYLTVAKPNYSEDVFYIFFLFGLFISGGIFGSLSFSMLTEKGKGSYWLSFPASHLEKLLVVIFYNTILFVVVYCALFFILKSGADAIIHNLMLKEPHRYKYDLLKVNDGFWQPFSLFIYAFFAVQAFYILGSVYFSRYAFIITTIVGAIIIFTFLYYLFELDKVFFSGGYQWRGTEVVQFADGRANDSRTKIFELPEVFRNGLIYFMRFSWMPVFWLVTWYRLKEKQL
jgi:hypothetical protein